VSIYSGGGSQVADVVFSPMALGLSTTVQEVQKMWNNFCFFIGYLSPFTKHVHLVAVLQQQISCVDLWYFIRLFTCATHGWSDLFLVFATEICVKGLGQHT